MLSEVPPRWMRQLCCLVRGGKAGGTLARQIDLIGDKRQPAAHQLLAKRTETVIATELDYFGVRIARQTSRGGASVTVVPSHSRPSYASSKSHQQQQQQLDGAPVLIGPTPQSSFTRFTASHLAVDGIPSNTPYRLLRLESAQSGLLSLLR